MQAMKMKLMWLSDYGVIIAYLLMVTVFERLSDYRGFTIV